MAFAAKDAAFIHFVPFFYTQVVGLSGTLYGVAAFVGQLSDAVTDPIFGTLSDNSRSRWGRRHPWMTVSFIPLAICFLLLFSPPRGLSQGLTFLWLAAVAVALRTFLTSFAIPHAALGAELSSDYEDRSLIVSYRMGAQFIAGVVLPWAGLSFFFSRNAGETDGRLVATNYSSYAWMSALLAVVTIAACCWGTRREIPHLPVPPTRRRLRLLDPLRDVLEAVSNRNFRGVFLAMIWVGVSMGVAVTLAFYTNTYFWEFSSRQIGLISLSAVVPTCLGFTLVRPLTRRFEKKSIFVAAVLVMIVNALWWIPGRLVGLLPANGSELLFGLAFVHQFTLILAVFLWSTVYPSIVADIVDEHEVATGQRKEGVFFAGVGFSAKVPTGIGQLVGGILIDLVDLPSGAAPGSVPADILLKLGFVAGPLIALSFLVPLFFLRQLDLGRERHAELRRILEQRQETTV